MDLYFIHLFICSAENRTQYLTHARQALHRWATTPVQIVCLKFWFFSHKNSPLLQLVNTLLQCPWGWFLSSEKTIKKVYFGFKSGVSLLKLQIHKPQSFLRLLCSAYKSYYSIYKPNKCQQSFLRRSWIMLGPTYKFNELNTFTIVKLQW